MPLLATPQVGDTVDEFRLEAVLSNGRSPWICEVIELPSDRRSGLYTVMPQYIGETLEVRLQRTARMPLVAGIQIAIKLAKAVAALHRAGVIHRDIKPENVIVQPRGDLKLLDLGVARLRNMDDFAEDERPGTPSYMAPELFEGAAATEASDLYALGVTVFRMFSGGAYPYGEIEPFSHPQFRRRSPLAAHRPDLPAWLDQILGRALAVPPTQRYDDVVEFAFALEHGSIQAAPAISRRQPLLERNPLKFWQLMCALLAALLLAAGAFILSHAT